MKKILLIVASFLVSFTCAAQNTATLIGNLVDSDSVTWQLATWNATLFNPHGGTPVYINGQPVPQSVNGYLSNNGTFSGTLPINTQILPTGTSWTMKICPIISAPCQTFAGLVISTTTFNAGNYYSSFVQAPRVDVSNSVNIFTLYSLLEASNQVSGSLVNVISAVSGNISNQSYLYGTDNWFPFLDDAYPIGPAGGDLCGSYPNPTVCGVNGATVPLSASVLGSNNSGQLVNDSANVTITGGNVTGLTNFASTNGNITNLNSSNANISGGVIADTTDVQGSNNTFTVTCGFCFQYRWSNPTNGTDTKLWDSGIYNNNLLFRALNDADSAANNWLVVNRTGYVVNSANFPETLQQNSNNVCDASGAGGGACPQTALTLPYASMTLTAQTNITYVTCLTLLSGTCNATRGSVEVITGPSFTTGALVVISNSSTVYTSGYMCTVTQQAGNTWVGLNVGSDLSLSSFTVNANVSAPSSTIYFNYTCQP